MRVLIAALLPIFLLSFTGCEKSSSIPDLIANAKQYQDKGDAKSAIIQLKNVLQQNPQQGEARYLLGTIYLRIGDARAAEKQFREALNAKYDSRLVLPLLARALFLQGELQRLLDATHSNDYGEAALQPEILSLRGHAQLSLGFVEDAAQSFEEALKRKPDFSPALLGKARLNIQKHNALAALDFANRAVAGDSKSLDGWLIKGDLERSLGHSDVAIAAYLKALNLDPKGVAANFNLASMQLSAGKVDEARSYAEAIRKAAPENPVGYYLLGLVEFRKNNFAAANEAVAQVLKRAPSYLPAIALSGAIAYSLGTNDQAEQQLRKALESYPNSIYLRKLLAAVLLKGGKTRPALEVLGPALEAAPTDADLLALTAAAHYRNRNIAEAQRYFKMAAIQRPASPKVRAGLGLARLAAGETAQALADLEVAANSGGAEAEALLLTSLVSARQFDKALTVVAYLEKGWPTDPATYNLKGAVLLARKDLPGARQAFEKALQLQPRYFPAAMNLAALELREKKPQAARAHYEKLLEGDPGNIEIMLALAKAAIAAGAEPDAIIWLERARKVRAKAFAPSYALAELYFRRGEYAKAIPVVQDALATQPEHAEALNLLGYSQLQIGQKNEALTTYSKLVSLYPKSAQAFYGLSGAQSAMGNQAAAMLNLKRALEIQPDFPNAIYALANLKLARGEIGDTLAVAMQVQKRYPKSSQGFVLEGDAYMANKKFTQAVRAYETAFNLEKSRPLLMRLHKAMYTAKQNAAADSLVDAWITNNPDDLPIRFYTADAAIKSGNYPRAISQYEAVLRKEPQNLQVLHNLGWCYQQQKDAVKALEIAERVYKINSDSPAGLDDLARLLLNKGETERALGLLEKARLLAPQSQEIRYHLAEAYVKSGDFARARLELEQLMRGGSDFAEYAEAKELLQRLKK